MLPKSLSRYHSGRPLTMQQWLLLSCGFSCLLLCLRIISTSCDTYLFLVWNLFLGFIPYAISRWLSMNTRFIGSRWRLLSVTALWLLFIPNSFYILTDIFHLEQFDDAPKWFDLLLLFSFAWNGLVIGVLSVRRMEMIISTNYGYRIALLFLIAVMWLNAFGIYIGRYLRYNSWDIFLQPFSLSREMLDILIHPLHNKMEWSMITVYGVFMLLLYATARKMGEVLSLPDTGELSSKS